MTHDETAHPALRDARRGPPRDRRGRGPRTPLIPAHLPGFRTRAEIFDQTVMEAIADLEKHWPDQLSNIEFAVDDVPTVPSSAALASGAGLSSADAVVDDGVPLARFFAPGVDQRGRPTRARIIVYRRPLEMRAAQPLLLLELVADVLAEQLRAVLGDGAE